MLGISGAAVSAWERVPEHRVDDVERVTGIPKSVLRPDLSTEREGTPSAARESLTGGDAIA